MTVFLEFFHWVHLLHDPLRSDARRSALDGRIFSPMRHKNLCARLEPRRAISANHAAQAGSIDRYTASADDELGYSLLAKPREKEESVGIAWAERDECMAQEVVCRARMQLEEGGVGERLRRCVHTSPTEEGMTAQGPTRGGNVRTDPLSTFDEGWRFNGRRLALARAALQRRVVGGLDEVPIVLSGPLLPRAGMTVDYLPWIRAMVRTWCSGVGSGKHWVEGMSGEGRGGLAS